MYEINFRNQTYQCRENETLLQAFLRQGVELSFSCQKGTCHVCMPQCVQGDVSGQAQAGLRPVYINKNYFLPCQCHPAGNLAIREIEHDQLYHAAYVHKKELLSETVCRLLIDCDKLTAYRPGQFINLCRPSDGLTRSYSLASHPEQDGYLELHVKRMKNGKLSNWIFDELQEQDAIDIQGPNGHCVYQPQHHDVPVLMVAGGTGLAPMLGVLREALAMKHAANIQLYHECYSRQDLYMQDLLQNLADKYENFSYTACLPGEPSTADISGHSAISLIRESCSDLKNWQVFLAGSATMVNEMHRELSLSGVPEQRVFADPFDFQDLRKSARPTDTADPLNTGQDARDSVENIEEVDYPPPDKEIWEALDHGKKLYKILDDFYTVVYADPRLSPFFEKITKQRSIEKVSLFMRQIFSGEKVYIGDRPRNAHHWMVISDELFDYREDLMEAALRKNGIPEHLIKRWRAIEETFRSDIVKDRPWKKVVNGVELPLDGYEELELDTGSMCDSCQNAIELGTRVRYHVRLGTIYCPSCMTDKTQNTGS